MRIITRRTPARRGDLAGHWHKLSRLCSCPRRLQAFLSSSNASETFTVLLKQTAGLAAHRLVRLVHPFVPTPQRSCQLSVQQFSSRGSRSFKTSKLSRVDGGGSQ